MNPNQRLEMLEQLIEKGSQDPFVWYAKALELRALERWEEAYEALVAVAEQFPKYLPTFLVTGQLAERLEKTNEAKDWFVKGIELAQNLNESHSLQELQHALSLLDRS